jgi:hypothetical protein
MILGGLLRQKYGQQLALCVALHMLSTLREIAERDIGGPRNTWII